MTTPLLLELFVAFLAAGLALWFVVINRSSAPQSAALPSAPLAFNGLLRSDALRSSLAGYVQSAGRLSSVGLLVLRLTIGVMMIHHGQEKLADPQQFADTYVASLHLPFPLFFAYAAGFSELIGSWLLILGLLTPLGPWRSPAP